jgi:hypothetical protein
MAKIANYKIAGLVATQSPFINYNASIVATLNAGGLYEITHWATKVLTYDTNTGKIIFLFPSVFSQTTSALVGRIVRNLPRQAVLDYLTNTPELSKYNAKRIYKMLWIG